MDQKYFKKEIYMVSKINLNLLPLQLLYSIYIVFTIVYIVFIIAYVSLHSTKYYK